MSVVNREALIASAKPKTREVALPDGNSVRVRALTTGQADFIKSLNGNSDKGNALLFAMAVVDENGNPMFDPNNPADLETIAAMSFDVVFMVTQAATELSGMTKKGVEGLAKN